MFPSRALKISLIIIVMFAVAGVASALAAANTVPGTYAGDGSGGISGYTISNIVYNLNASDPGLIDSVEFDLNAAAANVVIEIDSNSYSCTIVGGTDVTCDTTAPAATVTGAATLRVVAGDIVP